MRKTQGGHNDPIPSYSTPIVRAVVVAVYFADGQDERAAKMQQRDPKFYGVKNVAVDVLTYGGRTRSFLAKVPVVPRRHALNDYEGLWIPRAATRDLSTGGAPILKQSDGTPSDPRDLDGDHVLVEFLENDPTQPFIRDELPHPRTKYTQLKAAGDAEESRFRGVVTRIDTNGNVTVDTTLASGGAITASGDETPALDNAHGKVTVRMNHNAPFLLEGVAPDGSGETFKVEIDPAAKRFRVRLDNGTTLDLTDKDALAAFALGNGAVKAAIADHLATMWTSMKVTADADRTAFHAVLVALNTDMAALALIPATTGVGVATATALGLYNPAAPASVVPSYDTAINSSKLRFPDG